MKHLFVIAVCAMIFLGCDTFNSVICDMSKSDCVSERTGETNKDIVLDIEHGKEFETVLSCDTIGGDGVDMAESMLVSLYEAMQPCTHMDAGDIFEHDGRRISVFQIVDNFEEDGQQFYFMLCHGDRLSLSSMIIGIVSKYPYVTDEFLREGYYCYERPYTYKTKRGDEKTIRVFLEVSKEKAEKVIGNFGDTPQESQ